MARSIREKATDMALGLVQPRTDLGQNPRSYDIGSPHRRSRTTSMSKSQKPSKKVDIRLDIVLDTPVLVVPRSSCSPQVFVAHLGKISVNNYQSAESAGSMENLLKKDNTIFTIDEEQSFNNFTMDDDDSSSITLEENLKTFYLEDSDVKENLDTYSIDIRNMNLYSLDTTNRKGFRLSALPRAEEFYSCQEDAIAVLHDTAIRLEITRIIENPLDMLQEDSRDTLQIAGSVVRPLRLSLSRKQYEQLLETIENIFKVPNDLVRPPSETQHVKSEEVSEMSTFELNQKFKRRLFNEGSISEKKSTLEPKVSFELPIFVIQLKNEFNDPLIEISFRDFNVNYEKNNQYETSIQVSLRSLLMEDLLRDVESKHRSMVVSSSPENQNGRPGSVFSSHSCPNLIALQRSEDGPTGSLPDNLESGAGFMFLNANKTMCPDTPPPSPQTSRTRQDNLVLYSSLLVDPNCPNFETQYNSLKQSSSIDFNSLDLVVSVESWFVLLNFFGLVSEDDQETAETKEVMKEPIESEIKNGNSELEISVRSLTLVLIRRDDEIAKANVSNAHFIVSKHGVAKKVEGKLGSMSLYDLSTHGTIYRERFVTSGNEALNFVYIRSSARSNQRNLNGDAKLTIQMSSVRYVHTKRFIMEIQAFFREFSQLQTVS